ncbi:uncharacterized protein [Primulina huaijiensis]|uniref:uncharacterized protein n=1 Tax=Primulina huaijiensis TaxID=1492673 RepID=UPI003CC6EA28
MVKKEREVIEVDDSSPSRPDEDDPPFMRPIFCLKSRDQLKETEQEEECFIVECGDLGDEFCMLNLGASESEYLDDADILVVSQKGQVACRDYPHPRHACAKYPFRNTPHNKYCKMCYCHVCDSAAPCKMWDGSSGHCHAFDDYFWNSLRRETKKRYFIID